MTKSDLIKRIAKDTELPKKTAELVLTAFTAGVIEALKAKGGKLSLVGLGTFYTVRRKARTGRHPKTGAPLKIKAKTVVRFKPGKGLKGL